MKSMDLTDEEAFYIKKLFPEYWKASKSTTEMKLH
ncbi:hypothetical protein L917_02157 [Phytophthora nicotianae]|uniref:Uncharacterized protein n=4 Tax=Phytophthora nicotianae TaxID=4792 RepID=V9FTU3_PHYNI|nr:hypothetical protein F443_02363 [Phytophthora nicotianae P1569]ETM01247.1 hypothetical protein L917_02157 [Phytophthora nicotianae]ETM54437.1 hypothetical protein L914_02243 [Phytophthora nicotianae]ETO83639.1 hypothetical protein F444_02359 [Phytophthora nicotianae P1976]